jgi:hypothetical protein
MRRHYPKFCSNSESCPSTAAMDCCSISRWRGLVAAWSCCVSRSRERSSPSRSRFRFCSSGGTGARFGFRRSAISSCCCSTDLLSHPRAMTNSTSRYPCAIKEKSRQWVIVTTKATGLHQPRLAYDVPDVVRIVRKGTVLRLAWHNCQYDGADHEGAPVLGV